MKGRETIGESSRFIVIFVILVVTRYLLVSTFVFVFLFFFHFISLREDTWPVDGLCLEGECLFCVCVCVCMLCVCVCGLIVASLTYVNGVDNRPIRVVSGGRQAS